ncbi:MAG: glycyl-radical enzyme activating protein [Bacillota bacterium]|nr:glycyl-radical enzyme activating protein [Bacillota bacterium]
MPTAPTVTGTIFSIMRFAVNDGPGIRTTVFLKGCPLDCWWCHNPESQAYGPELQIWPDRCIGCGACIKVCPQRSGVETNPVPHTSPPGCTVCGLCAAACPAKAREVIGWRAGVEDVMGEVARDTVFYDESGGGATFSGGEPLAQPELLLALLKACRARGIDTCVDTCGHAPRETLLETAAYTDLFLYDLKLMDPERHVHYTGASNRLVLDNLAALSAVHPGVTVRIPVIPGVNDADENIRGAGEFIAGLKGLRDVTLLPYHGTGAAKYARLGRPCRMEGLEPPPPARLEEIARLLEGYGLRVQIGG